MKAIGRNLIVNLVKQGVAETKGGLLLAEKQREDIRYNEGIVISAGDDVVGIKEQDIIYFDKAAAHRIEIEKEPYHVIRQENVVVVL